MSAQGSSRLPRPASCRSPFPRQPRSGTAGFGQRLRRFEHGPETPRRRLAGRLIGAVVSAALLLVASTGASIAQDDEEPLRLIPLQQDEVTEIPRPILEEAAPAPDAEPAAEGGEGGPAEAPAAASAGGGIVVGTLDAIDPDAAGVFLEGIEPLPADSWVGSRRSRIAALLPRLPAASPSFAMRRLALALLASPMEPPAGRGQQGALILSRAERLVAMGARDHALALLDRAGPEGGKEAIARIRNDGQLAALDYDAACEGISSKVGRAGDGHWRRLRILCQAESGLIEAATLGLELLRESDAPPDPAFDDTIYAMAGLAEPVLEGLDEPTPLRVAVWRLAQMPIPAEAVAGAPPDVLPAIVGAPEAPPRTRLLAAERAEATGALSVEALRDLYRETAFSLDERADALGTIESLEPPLGRSLMTQAIEAQTVPALRAELLAAALSLAEAQGAYGTVARALAHLVRTVPPSPETGWFSGFAGRALIAAGDVPAAAAWYALAGRQAPLDVEAKRGALRLWPLMLLSSYEAHLTATSFDAWLAPQVDEGDGAGAVVRANWLAILLDALGGRVDPEVWDRLLVEVRPVEAETAAETEAGGPAPALARGLRMAVEEGRLGETVLMALLLLGDGGPAATGLATVGPVVSSLVSVGLEEEARAIAMEAALAAGL